MWEFREGSHYDDDYKGDFRSNYRYGRKGSSGMRSEESIYREGYECGFEEGYSKAMKDTFYSSGKGSFGERMSR